MDAKLQEVMLDYGLEGYGLYWYCIELIAQRVNGDNLTFELEHDCRIIARNTGSTAQKVEQMMKSFIGLGLLDANNGHVFCLKLASRCDDFTAKAVRRKGVKTLKNQPVGVSPSLSDKVPLEEEEEVRRKKKEKEVRAVKDYSYIDDGFEYWWSKYPSKRRRNKPACKLKFRGKCKGFDEKQIEEFVNKLCYDVSEKVKLVDDIKFMQTTEPYLNKEAYNDE